MSNLLPWRAHEKKPRQKSGAFWFLIKNFQVNFFINCLPPSANREALPIRSQPAFQPDAESSFIFEPNANFMPTILVFEDNDLIHDLAPDFREFVFCHFDADFLRGPSLKVPPRGLAREIRTGYSSNSNFSSSKRRIPPKCVTPAAGLSCLFSPNQSVQRIG